jgi:hypothetical protein
MVWPFNRNWPTEIGKKYFYTSSKRTRKNVQSRARAAQLRSKIEEIKRKPEEEQTKDKIKTLKLFEGRREKKKLQKNECDRLHRERIKRSTSS